MLRIQARSFTAGIEPQKFSAPILRFMIHRNYTKAEIVEICRRNKWLVEEVPVDSMHDEKKVLDKIPF